MKKIISVLLSCTLLFTALVLPSSAANEVQVGGFQGFENFTGSTNTNFSIVEGTAGDTVYSGTKALKVAYTGGTIAYDLSAPTGYHYTVGEWYRVSVWVKPATGATGSTNVNLSENNASNPWNSTNLKVDHKFLTITSSTAAEWKEYTFTFQAQRTCFGLWIDGSGSSTFYLDNLKISPCYSLSAVSENTEQGTALVSTEKAAKGDTVTFMATPAAGCGFIGWYNESGSLVSADAEYKTEVTGDLALTAKFFPGVVQGFENFTGATNSNFSIVEGTAGGTVHSGTKALKVVYTGGTIAYDLSAPTGYHYTVGEWYRVSVWVKPETGVTGSTNVNLSENNATNPWNSTNLKVDHKFLTITSSTAAEWKEYTFTFQAQRACYGLWIDGSGSSTFYFDDLKIEKVSAESLRQAEVENAFTFNGTAIRTEGKQALRFKTTVNENVLAENALTGNVTVTEYGFVVLNKDLLNGAELTLNSTYDKNGATVTAPQKAAYNKENGTDIVFEQNGTLKTFTAALTGITEDRYSTEYAVRVYVKLSNGEVHYAGETQYMSVHQCAALAFDAEGGTYTDTAGNSWKESYATRSYLFENILKGKTVGGITYNTAPAEPAAQQ